MHTTFSSLKFGLTMVNIVESLNAAGRGKNGVFLFADDGAGQQVPQ